MSPSILDCNGLLVTEKANKEPDQKVEDELLQSASEEKDKDNQPNVQTACHTINYEGAIKKRIETSEEVILKLETHCQKQTCPKTFSLRKHPFLLRSSPLGTFREEERLRLSDKNSILMT